MKHTRFPAPFGELPTPAGQILARAAEAPASGTVRLDVEDCVVI